MEIRQLVSHRSVPEERQVRSWGWETRWEWKVQEGGWEESRFQRGRAGQAGEGGWEGRDRASSSTHHMTQSIRNLGLFNSNAAGTPPGQCISPTARPRIHIEASSDTQRSTFLICWLVYGLFISYHNGEGFINDNQPLNSAF